MIYDVVYRKKEHYEYVSANEIRSIIEDIKKCGGCLIYGAGRYADAVLKCLYALDVDIPIIGIAVSDTRYNPAYVGGYSVKGIKEYADFDIPVLIATQECWQEEIFNGLYDRGYRKIVALSQLHINQLGEMYYKEKLRGMGIEADILDLMNVKRIHRDFWKNRFNNMCDLFDNIKMTMYRRASEETADFVVANMLNAKCYDTRLPMHYEVCKRAGEGLYLEFGVAAGGSINYFADVRKDRIIYGFDSFDGLPEDWNIASTGFQKGSIRQNKLPEVRENVELVVGLFDQTLPDFLNEHKESIAFIHIDCDLYSSAKYVLQTLMENERIVRGTEIIFDEYMNFPGWKQESEYTAFQEMTEKYGIKFEYTGFAADSCQVSVKIQ